MTVRVPSFSLAPNDNYLFSYSNVTGMEELIDEPPLTFEFHMTTIRRYSGSHECTSRVVEEYVDHEEEGEEIHPNVLQRRRLQGSPKRHQVS